MIKVGLYVIVGATCGGCESTNRDRNHKKYFLIHFDFYSDLRKNRLTGEDSNVFHGLDSLKTL